MSVCTQLCNTGAVSVEVVHALSVRCSIKWCTLSFCALSVRCSVSWCTHCVVMHAFNVRCSVRYCTRCVVVHALSVRCSVKLVLSNYIQIFRIFIVQTFNKDMGSTLVFQHVGQLPYFRGF